MSDATTAATATTCSDPMVLHGQWTSLLTGEVKTTYEKPCGSRLASVCPHCSEVYHRDAMTVMCSGRLGVDGKPVPWTFLTFTAPGSDVFGVTHQRVLFRKGGEDLVRRCPCNRYHDDPKDPLIGTPLDPGAYRYDLATDFNKASSRLVAVTLQKLKRLVDPHLQYFRTAEPQRRGLVHFHIMVRGVVSQADLNLVVNGGVHEPTKRHISPARHAGWTWGPQCDARVINVGRNEQAEGKASREAVSYMLKLVSYATKGTDDTLPDDTPHGRRMREAAVQGLVCGYGTPDCSAGSEYILGTMHRWQSPPAEFLCRAHRAARRGWGFQGHVVTKSRSWGLTFAEVRARRQEYATGQEQWRTDVPGSFAGRQSKLAKREALSEPREWSPVPRRRLTPKA